MMVMDIAAERLSTTESGIRPFDIGRDLRPVAELIADAFTSELDPRGMAALREMRIMSHIGGLLKLLNRSTGEFDDIFNGFVWVEHGKVVGNVTVQRADRQGNRWQIANVAVAPPYRGRGIAHMLMDRALEHIEASDGDWAVLQVYAENQVARRLYEHLDFDDVGGTTELRLDRMPDVGYPEEPPGFRAFSSNAWQPLYELATSQLNGQTQWWRALRRSDFQVTFEEQIGEWLARTFSYRRVYRRCIQSTRRFEAASILSAQGWRGAHDIQLWVRPENYGRYELPLLQWMLATLRDSPDLPVDVKVSMEHQAAIDACTSFGFRVQQTLITMRRKMTR